MLESSQVSGVITIPSPHIGVQILKGRVHVYPVSIKQVEEQPSPLTTFPSSQVSPVSRTPFPQFEVHTDAVVGDPAVQV